MAETQTAYLEADAPPSLDSVLPKRETGALEFISEHPEWDGRGIRIGILDSGVDPGAEGLCVTTTGSVKVVELIDATGDGDVDVSTVVSSVDDDDLQARTVQGLSGRKLILGNWSNPTDKWHIGIARAYDLFDPSLQKRMKQERKEKWDILHAQAVAKVQADLDTCKDDAKKKDLEELQKQLTGLAKDREDPGPLIDTVVFHNGTTWVAVIGVVYEPSLSDAPVPDKMVLDLSSVKPISSYNEEHEFGVFGSRDMCNYGVNISNDGNLLSIVTCSSSHGTHVAGIAAACYPDNPDLNGIAPGAEIVSIKVFDNRIDTMETGTALVRALTAAVKTGCDIINFSGGEASFLVEKGKVLDAIREAVHKHNLICCIAAGNCGPALSTTKAPGCHCEAAFGVGAYLPTDLAQTGYAIRKKVDEGMYVFTSRGPNVAGGCGICISAPGGAVSPIPTYLLQRADLYNGTSMAAPSACGGIALLLGACKSLRAPDNDLFGSCRKSEEALADAGGRISPWRVRRAIQSTARQIPRFGPLAAGAGLLQIPSAFTYLERHASSVYEEMEFRVRINVQGTDCKQGIYLREHHEMLAPANFSVQVRPTFPHGASNQLKVDFNLNVRLECTGSFVTHAKTLHLTSGTKAFTVEVDPTGLEENAVHFAELHAFDTGSTFEGPVFTLPITVVKPAVVDRGGVFKAAYTLPRPLAIERSFMRVPSGCGYADVIIRDSSTTNTQRLYVLATNIVRPIVEHPQYATRQYLFLTGGQENMTRLNVEGGATLEVCVAQGPGTLGESSVEIEVRFRGVSCTHAGRWNAITLTPSFQRVELVCNEVQAETVVPVAELTHCLRRFAPKSHSIRPVVGPYDKAFGRRPAFELVLEYVVDGSETFDATPRIPGLNSLLYESPFESHLIVLYDPHKRPLAWRDYHLSPAKFPKGKTTVLVQIRHEDSASLTALKNTELELEIGLGKDKIPVDVYHDVTNAMARAGDGKFTRRMLRPGQVCALFLSMPGREKWGKVTKGDVLTGHLRLAPYLDDMPGVTKSTAGRVPIVLSVANDAPPASGKKPDAKAPEDKEKTILDKLRAKCDNAGIAFLASLKGAEFVEVRDELKEDIEGSSSSALALYAAIMRHKETMALGLEAVMKATEDVLSCIDTTAVAAHFGLQIDSSDPEQEAERKSMQEKKSMIIDAYAARATAAFDAYENASKSGGSETNNEESKLLTQALGHAKELFKWEANMDKSKHALVYARKLLHDKNYGKALSVLSGQIAEKKICAREDYEKLLGMRQKVFEELGWHYWVDYEVQWSALRFPKDYRLF